MRPYTILFICIAALALPSVAQQSSSPKSDKLGSPEVQEEIEDVQEELGDQDFTNFRPRLTFKYNHKAKPGDTSANRVRVRTLWSFGQRQRFAAAVQVPFISQTSPTQESSGIGDIEFQFGGIINQTRNKRFAQAAGVQFNVPSASQSALGRNAAVFKVLYGNAIVLSEHWFLDTSCNIAVPFAPKQGYQAGAKEIEPEWTLTRAFHRYSVFLYSDNYYDWPNGGWGTTIELGASKKFGEKHPVSVKGYYEYPLTNYAKSAFHYNVGVDVNFYLK